LFSRRDAKGALDEFCHKRSRLRKEKKVHIQKFQKNREVNLIGRAAREKGPAGKVNIGVLKAWKSGRVLKIVGNLIETARHFEPFGKPEKGGGYLFKSA